MIRRREFIAALGGAAAWPLLAHAQQRATPVVGYLDNGFEAQPDPDTVSWSRVVAFRSGLAEAGYVDGRTLAIEYRYAQGQADRLPSLAADLVQRKVAAIFTSSTPATLAAQGATRTIPIIFRIGTDPVASGIVRSLAHPGGNATGATTLDTELMAKRVELIHEVLPPGALIALVVNPTFPAIAALNTRDAQMAARVLGRQLLVVNASNFGQLESTFADIARQAARGVVLSNDITFGVVRMATLARRYGIAAISGLYGFAAAGGLMSYGEDQRESWRIAGAYVGRILKGEKPADLPVQQATRVRMVLNLEAATALGLAVPPSIRLRATEVIE
jgi:putative ABC transport system substrate-binding protein